MYGTCRAMLYVKTHGVGKKTFQSRLGIVHIVLVTLIAVISATWPSQWKTAISATWSSRWKIVISAIIPSVNYHCLPPGWPCGTYHCLPLGQWYAQYLCSYMCFGNRHYITIQSIYIWNDTGGQIDYLMSSTEPKSLIGNYLSFVRLTSSSLHKIIK